MQIISHDTKLKYLSFLDLSPGCQRARMMTTILPDAEGHRYLIAYRLSF